MTVTLTPDRLWKVTGPNGESCHGGRFTYDLPKWDKRKGWIPGAWTPRIVSPVACQSGYHVCRDKDLLQWCNDARIWAVETRGPLLTLSDKVVAQEIRLLAPTPWDETTARIFAVECAADVLHIEDTSAILEVAYRYAIGDATDEELSSAWDSARASAWASARASAWDSARASVRASARASAWDSARASVRDSAWDSARASVRDSAWDSAWDSARASAWDSAWDSAWAKQTRRLLWWLGATDTYPED